MAKGHVVGFGDAGRGKEGHLLTPWSWTPVLRTVRENLTCLQSPSLWDFVVSALENSWGPSEREGVVNAFSQLRTQRQMREIWGFVLPPGGQAGS